ncbi:MAG: CDP-alcohol phosphatidyltransferase family protein [Candidatus Woesearchaeota archaeon]
MNTPNKITILRISLAPFIFLALFNKILNLAIILLLFAFISDVIDGYLARKLKEVTKIGKILDALADKLIVFSALLGIILGGLIDNKNWFYIPLFFSKDILNLIFLVSKKFRKSMKSPRFLGKVSTFMQAIALFWIIFGLKNKEYLVYAVCIIGIVSSIDYFVAFTKGKK